MPLFRREGDVPRRSLWQRIRDVALTDVAVLARGGVAAGSLEELEQALIEADFGVAATVALVAEVEREATRGAIRTQEQFQAALQRAIERTLRSGNSDPALRVAAAAPTVILVLGVNGAGKTTFVAKLCARYRAQRK